MVKVPPFRTFVQPSGLPTTVPLIPESKADKSNIFVDVPTLTYWYWMMCSLTIDLGYTVKGDDEALIRRRICWDTRTFAPTKRLTERWPITTSTLHDDEWGITSSCRFLLNQPRCDALYQRAGHETHGVYRSRHSMPWKHHGNIPADTRFGLCLKFEEYADNRDFTICSLIDDIPDQIQKNPSKAPEKLIIASYKTRFLDHEIMFYMSTPYPEEITARFDYIRIIPEFFEIDPNAPT